MTGTWPEKVPLSMNLSTHGYGHTQATIHPSSVDDPNRHLVASHRASWDTSTLSDVSISDDEGGDPIEPSIMPEDSLHMPTIDVSSENKQSLPLEHSKRLHIIVAAFSWVLNLIRSTILFIARDYSIVLSIIGPAIAGIVTIPALCSLDLIAPTYLCRPQYGAMMAVGKRSTKEENILWADFSGLAELQKSLTDSFVGDGPGASELAIKIAKAELATSDLIVAVRFSTLRTADELADSLTVFVKDAGEAGDGLQELDAKAMGAIDSIVNLNVWAYKAIEEARAPSGTLSSLAIWQSKRSTQDIINDNFNEAMRAQDRILTDLITQATISQGQLKRMKERLQAIRDLAILENTYIDAEHDKLLASIWTTFGSNRQDVYRYQSNLELLGSLEEYTDVAKAHIAQALMNLKAMQAQMKDLREKVSQPDITGATIPVDVHIKTIMDGIQRLKEGRIRARKRESDIRTIGA